MFTDVATLNSANKHKKGPYRYDGGTDRPQNLIARPHYGPIQSHKISDRYDHAKPNINAKVKPTL